MGNLPNIKRFTVVTGHYGCGKTNLAINLALDQAKLFGETTLVDLDVVNPYFRSSDHAEALAQEGVHVIAPTFAGTTLDVPALSPAIAAAFDTTGAVIFDVGGDDVGATALGRYSADVARHEHDLVYVINAYRSLTSSSVEAAALLAEIERASRLKATGVINNSHLRELTTVETVLDSREFARETTELLGLPLLATTVPRALAHEFSDDPDAPVYVEKAYPVEVWVRTPWEDGPRVE